MYFWLITNQFLCPLNGRGRTFSVRVLTPLASLMALTDRDSPDVGDSLSPLILEEVASPSPITPVGLHAISWIHFLWDKGKFQWNLVTSVSFSARFKFISPHPPPHLLKMIISPKMGYPGGRSWHRREHGTDRLFPSEHLEINIDACLLFKTLHFIHNYQGSQLNVFWGQQGTCLILPLSSKSLNEGLLFTCDLMGHESQSQQP